jgi:ubiquinone/menaquinone biosynthesis C-methylase UbiE
MRLVDLGCGSGRLAAVLYGNIDISYVGIDIVQAVLDYAKKKAPRYQFLLHKELSIPQEDNSVHMVCAFSLFTHLLHHESYVYLEECVRILKPGGKVVFSFMEFSEPAHWPVFLLTKRATQDGTTDHLNMFIERSVIDTWAANLGLDVDEYFAADYAAFDGHALGQSVAVLSKPG